MLRFNSPLNPNLSSQIIRRDSIMSILTFQGKDFYRDGKKHVIMAGAMHYFRIPHEYWYDRLLKLKECGFKVFLAVILHNLAGLTCGYICALLLKCDRKTAITIAVEVGMQNSGLAAALAKQFFGINAALPGAVFSVWHNISGAIFAAISKKLRGKELEEEGKTF